MAFLSRKDIENMGAQIFSDYKRLPRFQGKPVQKVEPEILAQELCGLHIDHCHLSKDRLTLGLTAHGPVGVCVYDDSNAPFVYYLDGRTLLVEKSLWEDPAKRGRYQRHLRHEHLSPADPRPDPHRPQPMDAGLAFCFNALSQQERQP